MREYIIDGHVNDEYGVAASILAMCEEDALVLFMRRFPDAIIDNIRTKELQ